MIIDLAFALSVLPLITSVVGVAATYMLSLYRIGKLEDRVDKQENKLDQIAVDVSYIRGKMENS